MRLPPTRRAAPRGLALTFAIAPFAFAHAYADGHTLIRHVWSCAAVHTSGGSHELRATLGESLVGATSGGSYRLRLGFWGAVPPLTLTDAPSPVSAEVVFVNGLRSAFPNPSRGETTLTFTVAKPSAVHLAIHDVTGRRITTLRDQPLGPGVYRSCWDGHDDTGQRVASGVYFCRLDIGSWTTTNKILVLR